MRWSITNSMATVAVAAALSLTGCSTTGGIYNSSDSANSEFSVGRTLLGVLGAAAAVAAAREVGKAGGGGYSPATTTVDYDWAWDQFRNEYGQLVWACRGKQTGQFALNERCQFKPANDFTWPEK